MATWNLADAQQQMSDRVIATLKSDQSLASFIAGAGDIFYTLGDARQEGDDSVVPYTVLFAATT